MAAVDRVIRFDRGETVETRFNHPVDGSDHVRLVRLVPEHDSDGALVSVLGIGHDITDIVRHRETLERIARTDALTGVANRQLLYERAGDLFVDARARKVGVGLMLLDLDGFKHVNDRLGHRAGDDLLRIVSQRLAGCLRERDLLVRLGGDEFVIAVNGVHERDDLSRLADRVRLSLAEINADGGARFARVDASIGIAMFPHDGASVDVLLARADVAMYEAKRTGRGRVEHFRPELAVGMERRAAIEEALEACDFTAAEVPGFEIHLQPVFRLADPPVLVGAEALARWSHPSLGVVAPSEFIPVAEESGRIVQLGRWALQRSAQIAAWCNAGRATPLRVGVNVSTRQFALDDVVVATDEALERSGCDPAWLLLEITESLLLEDSASVRGTLDALRERGVGIAIDDFGMGYSALHYLSRFPVDDLKIDRAFTAGIGQGARRTELVRAFVALADALGLDVIAEGIETAEQVRFLQEIGCGQGQGYLLARPMPLDAFEEFDRAPVGG
jgi:diguanylate cyclase (GGDEF)-like protein